MISTFPTWNLKLSLLSTDDDVDESVGGIDFHLQLLSSLLVPVDEAKPHGGGVGVEQLKLVMVMVTMIMVMVMITVVITVVMEALKIPSSTELRQCHYRFLFFRLA